MISIDDLLSSKKNEMVDDKGDLIKNRSINEYFNILKVQMDELKLLAQDDPTFMNSINELESSISNLNEKINLMNSELINKDCEIEVLKGNIAENHSQLNALISKKESVSSISEIESEIRVFKYELMKIVDIQIRLANNQTKLVDSQVELNDENSKLKQLNQQYAKKLLKLDANAYYKNSYEEEIKCNRLEVEYFKNKSLVRNILSPFGYLYMIFKSGGGELSLNFKLYKALKNSKCFNVGRYLNYNGDLQESFWYNYLSLELHYVCMGFKEGRRFNRRLLKINSKKDLLDYIIACDK